TATRGEQEAISCSLRAEFCLPKTFHNLIERLPARTHSLQRQRRQRLVDEVQLFEEIVAVGLDVDESGRKLAAPRRLVQAFERRDLVRRIVRLLELLQEQTRSVVHAHLL